MSPKCLSLVAEEADASTGSTSGHHQMGKQAKTRATSKENDDAVEEESDERSDSDYDEDEKEDEEEEHRHAREHAKAGLPSKGKKRKAPVGVSTIKAAKKKKNKKKTSAPACQVRGNYKVTVGARSCASDSQNLMWRHVRDSNRRYCRREGFRGIAAFRKLGLYKPKAVVAERRSWCSQTIS